jgi:thiamine-phosphate pyrophosphorylase
MAIAHDLSRSLFMLTEPAGSYDEMMARAGAGIRGGVTHVVLRRPNDPASELFRAAQQLSPTFRDGATWSLLVHERVDVALAAHAQGSHLRLNSLPGGPARHLLGDDRLMGVSVHNRGQATAAILQDADYVMFGHVYETPSYPGQPGRGLDMLREVVDAVNVPVIAIGGITAESVDEVLAVGASGVAVIRAIGAAEDPEAAASELREALDRADYPHLSPLPKEA